MSGFSSTTDVTLTARVEVFFSAYSICSNSRVNFGLFQGWLFNAKF